MSADFDPRQLTWRPSKVLSPETRQQLLALCEQLRALGVVAGARLCADTRRVRPGDVLVAWPGASFDPRSAWQQALADGAAAVVVEAEGWSQPQAGAERVLALADLQALAGWLASLWYGEPSSRLDAIAVTGTNGKTTVTQFVAQAMRHLGEACATVGTLGCRLLPLDADDQHALVVETGLTTPEAIDLQSFLAMAYERGARSAAIEASSIGVDQGRLNGLTLQIAAFTNFTRDHLDFHATMSAYAQAKLDLLAWQGLVAAVINLDDPTGQVFAQICRSHGVFVFGFGAAELAPRAPELADVFIEMREDAVSATGQCLRLCEQGGEVYELHTALLGRHNLENLLTVAGILRARGIAWSRIVEVLPKLVAPAGRLQALGGDAQPLVVVDYAHTPDALSQALRALRPVATQRGGQLHVVFGCGGDRDPGKRPLMTQVAAQGADRVVLTSDNPRSESPGAILDDMERGLLGGAAATPVARIEDRRDAILSTIAQAQPEDVVLIAGKGHEQYQEIRGRREHFDDVEVATAALNEFRLNVNQKGASSCS